MIIASLKNRIALKACTVALLAAAIAWVAPVALAETTATKSALYADNVEIKSGNGGALTWDIQGWAGAGKHKAWFRLMTALPFRDKKLNTIGVQGLYSHALSPNWELQGGIRYDFNTTPTRVFGVLGVQGALGGILLDIAAFVSTRGDLSLAFVAEYDFALSSKLFLQPTVEFTAASATDQETGIGRGLSDVSAAMRLFYIVRGDLTPYIGVNWTRALGRTARLSDDVEQLRYVVGVRFVFGSS